MGNNTFGNTVGGRNDQIIILEVEKFCGQRKKGQIKAIFCSQEGKMLEKTGFYFPFFNLFNLAFWKMKEGIKGRLGKDFR